MLLYCDGQDGMEWNGMEHGMRCDVVCDVV